MLKIKTLSEHINLDILHPLSLLVLIICNLKVPYSGKLLETFAWKRGLVQENECDTSEPGDKEFDDAASVSSTTSKLSTSSTSSLFSHYTVSSSMSTSASSNVKEEWSKADDKRFEMVVKDTKRNIESNFCTVFDWEMLLKYVAINSTVSNYLTKSLQDALDHELIPREVNCVHALLHISIAKVPSAKLLERYFLRQNIEISDIENTCHRIISSYNDKKLKPETENELFAEILLNCHVMPIFYQHMTEFLQQAHKNRMATKSKPAARRMRLRFNEIMHNENVDFFNVAHTFQTWAAQQKFSVHSSRFMQLLLYFIATQPSKVDVSLYAENFDKSTVQRMHENKQAVAKIDENAILELLRVVRHYSCPIRNMFDFQSTCLSALSKQMQNKLSPTQRFVLYVIAFQHESIRGALWKQIIPTYNYTLKQGLLLFSQKHDCDYHGVLQNFFMAHNANVALERTFKNTSDI